MKKAKMKVMADIIYGVFEVKSFEDYDQECEVLSPADFIESLNDLEAGELIGTEIDREEVAEYGIHLNPEFNL